jgi:preprotein translocase subunit SecG
VADIRLHLKSRADGAVQTGYAGRYAVGVETVLSVLQIIVSVVLIFLVLMHSGKDAGLSGAFGVGSGAGPLGGGSMVERNLNRWTIFFAVLFVVNTIVLLKKPWA